MKFSASLVAAFAAVAIATPVSLELDDEAQMSMLEKRWESMNPLSKRAVRPDTINALTDAQRTAQRTALITAGSVMNAQNILFPNAFPANAPTPPQGTFSHDASNITFQFINNTVRAPTGGTIFLSTINNFPALQLTGLAQAVGFVNPCGINTPHWHPRANEFLTVVQGSLKAALILEDDRGFGNVVGGTPQLIGGLPYVNTTLSNYTGLLFPKGLAHWQFNDNCEPAVFVAGFDSPDPGRAETARNFFSAVPDEVVTSSVYYSNFLSPADVAGIRSSIPSDFTAIVESCANRCRIPFRAAGSTNTTNE